MGTKRRPATTPVVALFALLLTVASTDASTCKPAVCGKAGGNGIFTFTPGHTYTYHLDGRTTTEAPEQQGEPLQLELKATAEVHFGADCAGTIKLSDVVVTGPGAKKYTGLGDLEKHAARFSYNDGVLEPELCAEEGDNNAALNIKRAVLSLIQVATPQEQGSAQKHETDIFGTCPTDFVISKSASGSHVTKTRNLNRCSHRERLRLRVATPPVISESDLQSSPALDAQLSVSLTVKGGVLQSADSVETYLYRPFSNKDHGAKTVVHTQLTYVSQAAHAAHAVSGEVSRSLVFDAPHDASTARSSVAGIIAALHAAEATMPDSVGDAAAAEFRRLIDVFRGSNKDDLLTAYGQVKAGAGFQDKVSSRKVYLHALLRAGTGDSIQVAVELLKSNEILRGSKVWHHSFAFVRHATPAALHAAGTLVTNDAPKEVFLGVGSLLGRFCDDHDCAGVKEVDELLSKLSKPLAGGCKATTHAQEDALIFALRGLENARRLNEKTAQLLRVCAADTAAPARVRVAALDTYKADACQPQLKKSAAEILTDRNEDSEIRIKAYLAAVECPCGKCANTIKTLLDTEPVNQVGSYIVSHLRNIRASKDPHKAEQRRHFSEIRASRRFPEDFRRYSHHQEASYFLDAVNVGAAVERSVLFSQQSYLPRSAEVKLSSEVFGHSFNLIEIESRAQNLDRLVEAYFGPRGVLRAQDLEQLVTNSTATLRALRDRVRHTLRHKRSVDKSKLNSFRNKVTLDNDRRNIDLDLNVKVFDSSVSVSSYHGDGHALSPDALIDGFFDRVDKLAGNERFPGDHHDHPDSVLDKLFDRVDASVDGLKSFNHDIKSHGQLFESELSYPTGLGLPLKLSVSVTGAVHLKLDGKIDLKAIAKDPKNAHVQFEIVPSAALEVRGLFSVDAYAVEGGLSLAATLHSSTGVNVNLRAVDGSGIDVTVGLPVKKQELVNVKTEVLHTVKEVGHGAVDTAVAFNTKRKEYHGCFDQLSPVVGLVFCGDVGIPFEGITSKAAFYPLNGPAKLLLTVEADDVTTYKFRAVVNNKDPDHKSIEVLIDTPNSKTVRKNELLLEVRRKPNKEIRAKLNAPFHKATAEVIVVQTDTEQSLTARLLNGDNEYLAKVGASVSGSPSKRTYTPLLEFYTPETKGKKGKKAQGGFDVTGTVTVEKDKDSKKVTFNHVEISAPAGKVAVDGWLSTDPTSVSSDLKVTHGDAATVTVKSRFTHPQPRQFGVDAEVTSSQYPDLGVHLKWDYHREQEQLETNLNLVHGPDLNSETSRVTGKVFAKYHWVDRKDFDLSATGTVAYPLVGVRAHIEGAGTPKSLRYELEGTYQQHEIKSHLSAKTGVKAPGDYDVEFEAKVLGSSAKLTSRRDIVSDEQNKFSNSLELQPGGKYSLDATVTCKREPGDRARRIEAELTLPEGEAYKLDVGVEATTKVVEAHARAGVGAVKWVDVSAKYNTPPNPSGSFKVLLKDHVDGAGTFKYIDGTGSLSATVDLLKLGRKLKAAGDLTTTGTKRAANLDLFFNYDKDPKKKIHLATVTDVSPGSFDSQNIISVFEQTAQVNVKGSLKGKFTDGQLVGRADVIFPDGRQLTYTVDRALHVRPGNSELDVKVFADYKHKSGQHSSVQVHARGDKLDLKRRVFDVEYDYVYTNKDGKDLNYHALAKSLPEGDNHHLEFKGLVKGALIDKELTPLIHLKADVKKPNYEYLVKVDLASDFNLELTGKVDPSVEGKTPYHSSNNLELNLPTGELKNIKLQESWTFKRGHDDVPCHLEGWVSTTYNNAKTVKVTADVKGNKSYGDAKISLLTPKSDVPHVVLASFKVDKTDGKKREGSVTWTHGDQEHHLEGSVAVPEARNAITVALSGRSPHEKLRTLTVNFHGTRAGKYVETETTVLVNDKKSHVITKYNSDPRDHLFEFVCEHPSGKSSYKSYYTRPESGKGEFTIGSAMEHNDKKAVLEVTGRVPSANDFDIGVHVESTELELQDVRIALSHKGAGGGKTVTVKATEQGKEIIDGKLNYRFEDGSDAVLYEATGNLKVKGTDKAAKILFKRNNINTDTVKGVEAQVYASLGDGVYDTTYKRTNQEMLFKTNFCKNKETCGFSEIHHEHNFDLTEGRSQLDVNADWTAFGHRKLHLRAETERKEKLFRQTVELTGKKSYKYELSITDKDASVSLTTPVRTLAAEAKYHTTVDPANSRHLTHKTEAAAWLDKVREPTLRTAISWDLDLLRTDDSVVWTAETRLQNPALSKDLVVKSKSTLGGRTAILDSYLELDVFAKKNQKISVDAKILKTAVVGGVNLTALWEVKSKGQGLELGSESHLTLSSSVIGVGSTFAYKDDKQTKKELGFGYLATLERVAFFVKSPRELLAGFEATHHDKEGAHSVDATLEVAGVQAVRLEAHVEKLHKIVYKVYKKATPERNVAGSLQVDLASRLGASADWHQGGEKKELYHVGLEWNAEGKPVVSYSLDNIKALLVQTRGDAAKAVEHLKAASQAAADDAGAEVNSIVEGLKKARPNLSTLAGAYKAQVKAIKEEVAADESVKELTEMGQRLVGSASESLAAIAQQVVVFAEKLLEGFTQLSDAALNSLKRLVPAISQSINKIFQACVELSNALVNASLVALQNLVELVKQHEAEFQQIATVVAEISRDVARIVGRGLDQVWREAKDFATVLIEQLKALPVYGMIQERGQELWEQLRDLEVPEQLLETVKEVLSALHDSMPTDELRQLVQTVNDLIEKVLKRKERVTAEELKTLHGKLVDGVKSVVKLIRSEVDSKDAPGAITAWPVSVRNALRLPILAAIRLSPIDFLRSDDLPTLRELWFTYRPTLNPLDWIPPYKSHGVVLDHAHFFTLDGRHFTFAGTCSYVLAQDVVDGNFTLVLNLEGGKFKSLQLSDDHDTVEVVRGGGIQLNGAAHELPLRSNELSAWARVHSVNLKSSAGVHVEVDTDHHFAVVHVSGFYHGRVRGLLGDLNNEQYDDFRLPSGKVTEDISEFGNAYQVGGACAPGAASPHHAHHGHHEKECSEMFAANSPLRHAFPLLSPTAFREACDHYLSETADRKQEYACRVANVYVNLARRLTPFVEVPSVCGSCSSAAGATWQAGDSQTVAASDAADVVLVVQQVTSNADIYKELVTPLVAAITAELKTKGVSDVKFALLGFGNPSHRWPAHHTVGGKLGFDGKAQLEFGEPKKVPEHPTNAKERWQKLVHEVAVEIGRTKLRDVIVEASKYPFRAGAAKAVILVTATRCEKSLVPFGLQKLRLMFAAKELRDRGITLHSINSLEDYTLAGVSDAKTIKSVVGFDSHTAYTLGDAKKKALEGNEELRKQVSFHSDVCAEAAQKSGGAVFHAANFLEGKSGARRNYVTVASHVIADSLHGGFTEECSCTLRGGQHAEASCRITARQEKKGGKSKK